MRIMESSKYGKVSNKNSKILFDNNYKPPFSIQSNEDSKGNIFTVSQPPDSSEDSESDDFFKSLRAYLIIGKLIGVLPFSGVFGGNLSKNLTFRRASLTSIYSHVIFIGLILNSVLGIISSLRATKRNALEIAESIRETLYITWGTFIFFGFLSRGQKFIDIFTAWTKTNVTYSMKDTTLKRDCLFISGVILTSAILENAVLHLEYVKELDSINGDTHDNKTDTMEFLETYYWRGNRHWAKSLNYNWFFAALAFFQHKWILYAWNYLDISIAVFGRAMYFRFKILVEVAEEKLLGPQDMRHNDDDNNAKSGVCHDHQAWLQLGRDHQILYRLLGVVETFFSPLVFASYTVNIYYICLQLLDSLTKEVSRSIVHSIYAPWSFIHLIMRTYIVSICCARINVYANRIMNILEECPDECYTKDLSRIDKRVTAGPSIGLTGLGCFVVTKPFMLSMLGVIFTLEIVLLQCVPHL